MARSDLERLLEHPRIRLGSWPTPIERHEGPGGRRLLVKRDDLSGFGRGGAKTRKIECILGLASRRGCRELVTVAGNITNVAFDLVEACLPRGIRPRLLVIDDPPADRARRERIFDGIREHVSLLGKSRAAATAAAVAAHAAALARGRRPLLLLPGLSHPAAVAGNALGFIEMALQLEAAGEPLPAEVHVTAATGTTVAGFLVAESALRSAGRPPVRIRGSRVYPGNARRRTLALIRWTERSLGLRSRVPAERVEIDDAALGGGFGDVLPGAEDLCARVGSTFGIEIDPFFGGKTWAAMERRLGRESAAGDILYWHCGFTPEWAALLGVEESRKGIGSGSGSGRGKRKGKDAAGARSSEETLR